MFFCCTNVWAASTFKKETPTRIRADIIDIKRKLQIVDLIDNVVVEKDDSTILADKMKVFYEETENETKVKKADAENHVKIFSDDFIANGDFGHYEPENDTFTLEKNVIVNNGTSIATGDKFIYNLITKKGNFIGEKNESAVNNVEPDKRVMVIIGDDFKTSKKNKND